MMISAASGFINQAEKYSRDNAGKSLKKYTLLRKGELAYNHGASKVKPYGCCFELLETEARIPYVYHCFKISDKYSTSYIAKYLNNSKIDAYLKKIVSSSVRMDGLLNISYEDYTDVILRVPSLIEQQKIADFLSLIDKRIEKQRQLVESLKKYKRGYLKALIKKLNTTEFLLENIVEEYQNKTILNMQYPILSSTMNGIKLQDDYFNKQAASENTIGYKIVPKGYFTYRSMSDTGVFRFNRQMLVGNGIVSPAYPVFKVKSEEANPIFVEYMLNEDDKIKEQLLTQKEGGTRYALSFSKFKSLKINLPDINIQEKIAIQITLLNTLVKKQEAYLHCLNKNKCGLLQQMFI